MSQASSKKNSSYRGKRVLVAGGGGFIGSFVVVRLLELGADVSVISRSKSPWRLAPYKKQVKILAADLTNKKQAIAALKKASPEIVFNVAAVTEGKASFENLDFYLSNTYGITENVFLAALQTSAEKFIHCGTIGEYYGNTKAPFKESDRETPLTSYGLGKVLATQFALFGGRVTHLKAVVLRLAPTFGPSQDYGMLIPNLIQAGLESKTFNTNPGGQLRDFVYVKDIVEGILCAGATNRALGEIINLGAGRGRSVKEVAHEVNKAMGNAITINFGAQPYRKGESMKLYMDTEKAKKILSWTPKTPFPQAIKETVAWYYGAKQNGKRTKKRDGGR